MPQLKRMAFPVDILTNVDHEFLELAAEEYMSQILYRNPDTAEYFRLPDSKQIEIGLCNVSFVPLYGTDTKKKLLALFLPDDFTTVVGLYLLGQWWGVEDVLKTAEPSRTGLIKVNTLGERIVLYVLNRIVLRNEKSSEDVSFLCHCEHESAKILWKDGEAIGFYSYKPKGSLCRNFLTQCYQLPVMDTIFVRKCHRGKGHGVEILEDFIGSFRKEYIGLKFPLSEAIYKVCEKYFSIHPADKEILWEVEKIGSPFQRTLIANRLQKLKLKEKDQVVSKLKFDEDAVISPMQIEMTKVQETIEYTVEIVEETITDITKEVDDVPVSRRGRGSSLKRRGIRENSEERLSKNIRVEDIEAGVESPIEVATEEHLDDTFTVKESETVLRSTTGTVTATVTNISELRSSQKEEEHEIEKDTATSEGTPVTHLTTAGEIESQRGSEEECEIVNVEHTVVKQGATIGSIDQNQLQSVVDIEIVKMSTGTEEEQNENLEKNKEVEEDKLVCETEEEEIKMLDEPEEEKAMSGTVEMYNNKKAVEEVTDQSETLANKAESESEVEEYREKEELTVDSTMDAEISQGETVDVVCEISEIDQEAPQQSSVESAEICIKFLLKRRVIITERLLNKMK
ncbi:soluble lamin-associated protein of 75 kDa [Pimephales promelas]|nr:soluble lamin-associated protein of 75 kDa [Pimephales promelas]